MHSIDDRFTHPPCGSTLFRASCLRLSSWLTMVAPDKLNFLLYLPQDDWLAGGAGRGAKSEADFAGANAGESQAAVDDSVSKLKQLLELPPRQFWKEGTAYCITVHSWTIG